MPQSMPLYWEEQKIHCQRFYSFPDYSPGFTENIKDAFQETWRQNGHTVDIRIAIKKAFIFQGWQILTSAWQKRNIKSGSITPPDPVGQMGLAKRGRQSFIFSFYKPGWLPSASATLPANNTGTRGYSTRPLHCGMLLNIPEGKGKYSMHGGLSHRPA